MRGFKYMCLPALLILSLALVVHGDNSKEITKEFKNIKLIKIKTFTGNCIVEKSPDETIRVHLVYEAEHDEFQPDIKKMDDFLVLRGCAGFEDSTWTVKVPGNTAVKFYSRTGDFSGQNLEGSLLANTVRGDIDVTDYNGDINLFTATGSIDCENLKGNINLKVESNDINLTKSTGTASIVCTSGDITLDEVVGKICIQTYSGRVDLEDCGGGLKVKSSCGNIQAENIAIMEKSAFRTAFGSIELSLSRSPIADLYLDSASDNITLDFDGHPIKGTFNFKARDIDKITSPFMIKPDKKKSWDKWGKQFTKLTVILEEKFPQITLSTPSGKSIIKE
ncbi:MAG: DUF4097 domain-containing protein [bacterium]|nr:DUF4097 domain-containing protein [bacterium]